MRNPSVPTLVFTLLVCWSASAWPMPGFVSGHLLTNWCEKNEGLDREACYSYLRGASDAFHAIADATAGQGDSTQSMMWPNECLPPRVSITALRDVYLEFAARHPEQLGRQAASLLVEVLPLAFPCEQPKDTAQ